MHKTKPIVTNSTTASNTLYQQHLESSDLKMNSKKKKAPQKTKPSVQTPITDANNLQSITNY